MQRLRKKTFNLIFLSVDIFHNTLARKVVKVWWSKLLFEYVGQATETAVSDCLLFSCYLAIVAVAVVFSKCSSRLAEMVRPYFSVRSTYYSNKSYVFFVTIPRR